MEKNRIGKRILGLCADRNISVEELAKEVGLTGGQIEILLYGDVAPSLAPLVKIARVLGVRIGTFLDDMETLGPVVQRKVKMDETSKSTNLPSTEKAGLDFFSLASQKAGRNMEPFVININATSSPTTFLSSHEGEEFLYVLEGAIRLYYGKDVFELSEGDSIYFDSIVDHLVEAQNGEMAKILAVLYAPI